MTHVACCISVFVCMYLEASACIFASGRYASSYAKFKCCCCIVVAAVLLLLLLWLHFQFSQFPRRICMSWDVEVNGDCRLKNGDGRLWDRRLIIIELTTGLTKSNSNSNNSSCCRCACNAGAAAAAAVDLNQCCCCFCCCCCRVSCRNS